MQILPFSSAALEEALNVLRSGGVIAHATETCYGLACDLRNTDAVKKLFAIKQRPDAQPVSGLFASTDEAATFVAWNEKAAELAAQYLPGPLTIILPLKPDAGLFPTPAGGSTLGVRVSSHPHALALAKAFGGPLSTSSANIHGQPNPYSAEDIRMQFEHAAFTPDLVLDGGQLPQTPPSTIVDLANNGETRRQGNLQV